jgi:hypothetical protein
MKHAVEVAEPVRIRAKAAIDAMLALGKPSAAPKFVVGGKQVFAAVELI